MRLYNYLDDIEVLLTNVTRFDCEITGVTSRSEEVREGYIFVCIKGLRSNGHSFACQAKTKGAVILVAEEITEEITRSGLPYIIVKNTRETLALMCARSYGNPEKQMKMIAVTGTNGKTSTCRIISEIYQKAGKNVVTLGTLGGGLTTPDPEDMFKELKTAFDCGKDTVVMEASSHALYLDKLYGVEFDLALFTNLTPEHLDFHNNMHEYAMAKAKLSANSKCMLYNIDDMYGETVASLSGGKKYSYSFSNSNALFYIQNFISFGTAGFEYELITKKDIIKIRSFLCGNFNVYNTMAAAALAYSDGISPDIIARGISDVKNVDGRLEKIDVGETPFTIYIDYAHSPDALQKVLECIRDFKTDEQKITVLFGCGGDRDRSKRKVMGQIASRLADFVIVTSDNSRSESVSDIIGEIMKGIDKERPHVVIEDRKEAIRYSIMNAKENSIILLAGKGHENYEIDSLGKRYFSEKDIVVEAVCERFKGK